MLASLLQAAPPESGAVLTALSTVTLLRAGFLLVGGAAVAWIVARWVRAWVGAAYNAQKALIAHKLVYYPALVIVLVSVLRELGFSLGPLLGAAGVLGIAIGFASQTSVSNIISGFFLLGEEPFKVGDVIKVGDVTGQVLTIDMLSVKIRTFENHMVRIPNETLVKSQFTNITRFPIRRMDIPVGVAYKEDAGRVRDLLFEIAREHPRVLMEPEPIVIFLGFGASSVDFQFSSWTRTETFLDVRNELRQRIKERFDEDGIEIPFPHVSLYAGSATEALPIRIVGEDPGTSPRGADPDEPAQP